jgi:hypothetical protein
MKTHDLEYAFCGYGDRAPRGRCRVRILQEASRPPVLVITELADNPSTSITNLIEHLVPELLSRYLPHRYDVIAEAPAIVIEHYPARPSSDRRDREATYDLVTFVRWRPRIGWTAGGQNRLIVDAPGWRRLRPEEVWQLLGDEADDLMPTPSRDAGPDPPRPVKPGIPEAG